MSQLTPQYVHGLMAIGVLLLIGGAFEMWRDAGYPYLWPVVAAVIALGLAAMVLTSSTASWARDDGRYAQSPLKQWFDTLKSGKGPCCSDADGSAVSDVDWESKDGRYRVRIDGDWIDVPDDAVITEPNRVGRTMVWPMRGYLVITIRCFMPGSMS